MLRPRWRCLASAGSLCARALPAEPVPLSLSLSQDVSHAVFLKLLEYLYTDTLSDVTPDQAVHLLVASEQ